MKKNRPVIEQIYSNYNVIKGRIGEAIIEQMFQKIGFQIYRYGIEKHLPAIAQNLNSSNKYGSVIESIRHLPDFVIHSEETGCHFIEVKFYQDGKIEYAKLLQYEHDEIIFVLITNSYIGCISLKEVKEQAKQSKKKKLDFVEDCIPLAKYPAFKLSTTNTVKANGFNAFSSIFCRLPAKNTVVKEIRKATEDINVLSTVFDSKEK